MVKFIKTEFEEVNMTYEIWYRFDKELLFIKCKEYEVYEKTGFISVFGSDILDAQAKVIDKEIIESVMIPINKIELIIEDKE